MWSSQFDDDVKWETVLHKQKSSLMLLIYYVFKLICCFEVESPLRTRVLEIKMTFTVFSYRNILELNALVAQKITFFW